MDQFCLELLDGSILTGELGLVAAGSRGELAIKLVNASSTMLMNEEED